MNYVNLSINLFKQILSSPSEKDQSCYAGFMPKDVFINIFLSKLSLNNLAKFSSLNKKWKAIVQPLIQFEFNKRFTVFGPEDWKSYGYDIGPAESIPTLPDDIGSHFKRISKFFSENMKSDPDWKERWAILVLNPKTINGTPICLNTFSSVMRKLREGGDFRFLYRPLNFNPLPAFMFAENKEAQWILLTNGIVPGSRNKTTDEQKNLIKTVDEECDLADPLQAVVGNVASFLKTGQYLFTRSPYLHNRCEYSEYSELEKCEIKRSVKLGAFDRSGFDIIEGCLGDEGQHLGAMACLPCKTSK